MSDYKPYMFTLSRKQSDYINDEIYRDRKRNYDERKYPRGERSELIRKLINKEMVNEINTFIDSSPE